MWETMVAQNDKCAGQMLLWDRRTIEQISRNRRLHPKDLKWCLRSKVRRSAIEGLH
jgi:hypothetical protein